MQLASFCSTQLVVEGEILPNIGRQAMQYAHGHQMLDYYAISIRERVYK
jgi:hypothetical protein